VFSGKLLLGLFEFSSIKVGVRVTVSEDVDNSANISLEASGLVNSPFSISTSRNSGSHSFDLSSEINLRASRGSSGEHHTESISRSGGLDGILTRSSTDVDTNSCCLRSVAFGNNSNSIRQSSALERTVVFERFRNLAGGKLTEVFHNRSLGELHMGLSGSDTGVLVHVGSNLRILDISFTFMLIAECSNCIGGSGALGSLFEDLALNSTGDLGQHLQ